MTTPNYRVDTITRYVNGAKQALENASDYCLGVAAARPDLPQGFTIAAEHLPTLTKVFTTIHDSLKNGNKEKDDDNKRENLNKIYMAINKTMKDYATWVGHLHSLFEAINNGDNEASRLKSYNDTVREPDNRMGGIESSMLHLLKCAILVAKDPLVDEVDIEPLKKALGDVEKLLPVSSDRGSGYTMNNYGEGSQFQHNGRGDQNVNKGGFQVTGRNDGARYTYAAAPSTNTDPKKPEGSKPGPSTPKNVTNSTESEEEI